jgi:hypothetical protein
VGSQLCPQREAPGGSSLVESPAESPLEGDPGGGSLGGLRRGVRWSGSHEGGPLAGSPGCEEGVPWRGSRIGFPMEGSPYGINWRDHLKGVPCGRSPRAGR